MYRRSGFSDSKALVLSALKYRILISLQYSWQVNLRVSNLQVFNSMHFVCLCLAYKRKCIKLNPAWCIYYVHIRATKPLSVENKVSFCYLLNKFMPHRNSKHSIKILAAPPIFFFLFVFCFFLFLILKKEKEKKDLFEKEMEKRKFS